MNKKFRFFRRVGVVTWAVSSIMVTVYIFGQEIIVSKLTVETLLVGIWFFLIAIGAMVAAPLYRDADPIQPLTEHTQTRQHPPTNT